MLGLQPPTSGEIYLNDTLVHPGLWEMWRHHAGVVSQADQMLAGTIAENIAFFDPDMQMSRVEKAAADARVHDAIMSLPSRYETQIAPFRPALSGGQLQRIYLARALYREPRCLILDEGTANLDGETEEEIADLLEGLSITRIVVAHRPALMRRADRVLTLENGRLFEVGLENRVPLETIAVRPPPSSATAA